MPVDHMVRASLPDNVRPRDIDEWVGWHRNVRQEVDGYFDIANAESTPSLAGYQKTTKSIQTLLKLASERDIEVRPFGGTWSFSDIAVAPGWMVDTAYLNWMFPIGGSILAGAYTGRHHELFFVQGGTRISQVNRVLEKQFSRSLSTSGASNGQTIAGAIGTGTHGSSIDQGGIQHHVVGIHLITGPDRHVWLERASDPATEDRFADEIDAELIRDDDLFNSALVSFGGMGFVAGVMIKTVPLFLLKASRNWAPFDDTLRHVVQTLDFSNITLPGQTAPGESRPYFFQAVINPFDLSRAAITTMYHAPHDGREIDYTPDKDTETGPGYELLGAVGALTDVFGGSIPTIVKEMAKVQLKPFGVDSAKKDKDKPPRVGTLGETFDFTTPRTKALGAAIAVALDQVPTVLDHILDEQQAGPAAPLIAACRFVRHSGGMIEFTQHETTCVIDIDGVNSSRAHAFLARVWRRLDDAGIAYTQHWGKVNNYDAANVRARFGDDRIDKWIAARSSLLGSAQNRALFSSPFLERLQLS